MNGTEKPQRKPRKRVRPAELQPPSPSDGPGLETRKASEIEEEPATWLLHPWFPRGMLSVLVGLPNTGKSTLLASLVAHVTGGPPLTSKRGSVPGNVVMLPSKEEPVAIMTRPRLRTVGADLERVHVLSERRLSLPRDAKRLARTVNGHCAELLVVDPIDSFLAEGVSENNANDVRPLLEAMQWVAEDTGCGVIAVRHPGKDASNVMPGSRAWRDVPRVIVELSTDGGIPPRYQVSLRKDGLGTGALPRRYELVGEPGKPKRFKLAEELDRAAEDLTRSASGPTGRYKLMQACRLIRYLFGHEDEPTRQSLGEEGRKQGLGEDTVNDALRLLGVRSVPPGERGDPWRLVRTQEKWPGWLESGVSI